MSGNNPIPNNSDRLRGDPPPPPSSSAAEDTLAAMPTPSEIKAVPSSNVDPLVSAMPAASITPDSPASPDEVTRVGNSSSQRGSADVSTPSDAPRIRGYRIIGRLGHGGMGV